jgi:hypothetical protein
MNKSKYLNFILIILLHVFSFTVYADSGPGDPGTDPVGNPPLGGGAPISNGLVFLIILGLAYGGKKVYDLKKSGVLFKEFERQ